MQLVRTETPPAGAWLHLEGDAPEKWAVLEELAVRGIGTSGPETPEERRRLEALLEAWNRTSGQPQGEWWAGYW